MGIQNPKITVSPETKSLLDSRKKHKDETYENVILSLYQPDTAQAPTPSSPAAVAGAGSGEQAFNTYSHILRWVSDTRKKMPSGGDYNPTPDDRETAYNIDPLVSGIITPFLKNTLLGTFTIQTEDNKKYQACIDDIMEFLKDIKLQETFREDFEDYAIKHGHSYRRKDYFTDNTKLLKKLQRLEAKAMNTYEDPWDSDIVAYHQRIYANDVWSSTQASKMTEYNSWFIPGGGKIADGIEETGAMATWEQFRIKYGINETTGLRVDNADKIFAMHKVRPGKAAPIDSAILAIWLKRLILANGPNYIFSVIMPFLHLKQGVMLKVPDGQGGEKLITSVPPAPAADMATTDPERYAAMNADRTAYTNALADNVKNIMRYRAEGGLFASSPDIELQVTESGRTISSTFIQQMIGLLDEDIARAFGFPLALISANGAELATSRTILELFNTAYAGSRQDYESKADGLIEERFDGVTWEYEITLKDGTTERGSYTLEDAQAHYKLETGDVKDALKEAQTQLTTMQMLQTAKTLGASRADIQALGEEQGLGLLDLDKFDVPPPSPFGNFPQEGKPEEKPEEKKPEEMMPEEKEKEKEETTSTAGIPQNEDEKLKRELWENFMIAKNTIEKLIE